MATNNDFHYQLTNHSFPEPKVASSYFVFCPAKHPKTKQKNPASLKKILPFYFKNVMNYPGSRQLNLSDSIAVSQNTFFSVLVFLCT